MVEGRTFNQHYNLILDNMRDTFEKKNHDYGDSTQKLYEQFNESYFIRIADKFNRINTLLTNNDDPKVDEKTRGHYFRLSQLLCIMVSK